MKARLQYLPLLEGGLVVGGEGGEVEEGGTIGKGG